MINNLMFIMLVKEEIKECFKHGMTTFGEYSSSGKKRWRCKACQVEATQRRRDKVKEQAIEYKEGKCSVCGYDKCKGALEFHHIDPSKKDFGISSKGYTRSWESIKNELDKCIMVCANCHREIHEKLAYQLKT